MPARNYSNTASDAEVAVLIGPADTTAALASYTGFPNPPYIAAIDPDTVDEEIVLVTNDAGAVATMTRAYDGSTAKTHSAGAVFRHVAAATDFQEANDHVNDTAGVHGVAGSLVGTSDTQTLSNKTLTSPTISAPTVTGTMNAAAAAFSGTVTIATGSVTALTGGTGHITGTLAVDGVTTLAAVNAQAVSGTTGAFSGAVTVAGTLGVTGALTGTSGAFSGALSGLTGTFTTTVSDEVELTQAAADPTAGTGRSSLYARTDFGLYLRPATQARRRVSMHWGQGITLPTTGAIEGDTFYDTALSSMLRYNGSTWRQTDVVQIANMAARPTGGNLHAGFQVFSLVDDDTYTYDGTFWRNGSTGGYTPAGATAGDYITGLSGVTAGTTNGTNATVNLSVGHTFSATIVYATFVSTTQAVTTLTAIPNGFTASTFQVQARDSGGSPAFNTAVSATWHVIGYND